MTFKVPALCLLLCGFAAAQVPNPTSQPSAEQNPGGYAQGTHVTDTGETVPLFRVQVVSRSLDAVNYRHLGGETKLGMIGTTLMPQAKGEAKVDSRHGRVVISAKFDKLGDPSQYGPEYLTYVLWAITPEGRAQNLGELPIKDDHAQLDVTSDLQTFGMVVTAEPYFAVTQPSDVVVIENRVLPDTKGQIEQVVAKYELLPRGQYVQTAGTSTLKPLIQYDTHDPKHKVPLGLMEGRNAVRLAQAAEADRYAADSMAKAQAALDRAEDYYARKQWKPVETAAREAAQDAEDARVIALRRHEQESIAQRQEQERQRTEDARARADAAEVDRQREADQRARAEQDRQAAEQARTQAELAQQQAEQARQAALTAQQQAEAQRSAAEQQAQQAQMQAQQAEQQKEELRQRLQQQLNSILQTRDTARGLIVNMSDVLFDTNKYTLKPGAREKLAKVSGILLAYPGLKVQVEGYTDSTGTPEYNQRLSEQRAMTVRDYLVGQGINMNSVSAQGFGENDPVASNASASGRQQNRRVQMVVSGEPIGEVAGTPSSTVPAGQEQYAPQQSAPAQQPQMQQMPQQPQTTQPTIPR